MGPVLSDSFVSDNSWFFGGVFFGGDCACLLAFELSLSLMIIIIHNAFANYSLEAAVVVIVTYLLFLFVACWCSRAEVDLTLGLYEITVEIVGGRYILK